MTKDLINWQFISHTSASLNSKFLKKYSDKIDWAYFGSNYRVTPDLYREFKENVMEARAVVICNKKFKIIKDIDNDLSEEDKSKLRKYSA